MSTNQTCNCTHAKCFHITTIVLIVAAIASSIWAGYQVIKMETLKVGGTENFEKLQTIMKSEEYQEQYSQSLDLMLQQLNGTSADEMFGDEMMIDESNIDDTTANEVEMMIDESNEENSEYDENTLSIIDQNETVSQ